MDVKLLILLICFDFSFGGDSNTSSKIEISYIKDCEDQEIPALEGLKCETEIVEEGPSKSLNATITVPFDVDDSLKYKATALKWRDGQWKPIPFILSGGVCQHVQKYLPGLWGKLSKVVNVPYDCPIKAGSYSVNGFTAESTDVKIPFLLPGKYVVSVIVLKDDKPILCKQSELSISKP